MFRSFCVVLLSSLLTARCNGPASDAASSHTGETQTSSDHRIENVVIVTLDATSAQFQDSIEFEPLRTFLSENGYLRLQNYIDSATWTTEAIGRLTSGRHLDLTPGYYAEEAEYGKAGLPSTVPSVFTLAGQNGWQVQYSTQNPLAGVHSGLAQGVPEEYYNAGAGTVNDVPEGDPLWDRQETELQFQTASAQLDAWQAENPDAQTLSWLHLMSLHDPFTSDVMDPSCWPDVQSLASSCSWEDLLVQGGPGAMQTNYHPPSEEDAEACEAAYKAADLCIARGSIPALVSGLTQMQDAGHLGSDTLLMVSNDHGECTGAEFSWDQDDNRDGVSDLDRCWLHYRPYLIDDQVQGMGWIGWQGMAPEDFVVSGATSEVDLVPTILDLTGMDPGTATFDGIDMREASPERNVMTVFWNAETQRPVYRVTSGDGAYALSWSPETPTDVFVNRERDPEFLVNLSDNPDAWTKDELVRYQEMSAQLNDYYDAFLAVQ